VGLSLQDHLQTEENFISEYKRLVSNPHSIMSLGWHPKTTFEQLADMMLNSPNLLPQK
jgi:GDP-D-mannose dehydratase